MLKKSLLKSTELLKNRAPKTRSVNSKYVFYKMMHKHMHLCTSKISLEGFLPKFSGLWQMTQNPSEMYNFSPVLSEVQIYRNATFCAHRELPNGCYLWWPPALTTKSMTELPLSQHSSRALSQISHISQQHGINIWVLACLQMPTAHKIFTWIG